MNISSTRISPQAMRVNQQLSAPALTESASEVDTFRLSSREKRNYITAGAALGGAALGSFAMAGVTGDLVGTGAKIFGGVSGALAGALIGAAAGAIGGGIGGAMLGTGAGNALGYAAGAVAGGVVGGFAARGMMNQ